MKELPVITITSNSPDVVLYVSEKSTEGFSVINTFGKTDINFDWSAFAKVEIKTETNSLDHLDNVFYRESFELQRGNYKEYVPFIGESKDRVKSFDTNKFYSEDMKSVVGTNELRNAEPKPTESIKHEPQKLESIKPEYQEISSEKRGNKELLIDQVKSPESKEEKKREDTKAKSNLPIKIKY